MSLIGLWEQVHKHSSGRSLQFHGLDSWGVVSWCLYTEKYGDLEKTAVLDDVNFIPGLMDGWGPSGAVGLFHFSFVLMVGYIRFIIFPTTQGTFPATCGVIVPFSHNLGYFSCNPGCNSTIFPQPGVLFLQPRV